MQEPTFLMSGKRFFYFGVRSYWRFRLSRFLISMEKIELLTLITRKISKLGFGPYSIQYLFTTV